MFICTLKELIYKELEIPSPLIVIVPLFEEIENITVEVSDEKTKSTYRDYMTIGLMNNQITAQSFTESYKSLCNLIMEKLKNAGEFSWVKFYADHSGNVFRKTVSNDRAFVTVHYDIGSKKKALHLIKTSPIRKNTNPSKLKVRRKKMIKNKKEVVSNIVRVLQNRADFIVLGLSGGVDSAVAACLSVKAVGKSNVYAFGMPFNRMDWVKYNRNAEDIAKYLNIKYKTIPIYDVLEGYKDALTPILPEMQRGLISRIRTNILYLQKETLAAQKELRGIVLGTSNMTEIFVGNHVKGGDALGDSFPLGDLYKSEVYDLAHYFKTKKLLKSEMIDYIPSSNLNGDLTTYDELGFTYEQIETVIKDWNDFLVDQKEKEITDFYNFSDIHEEVLNLYFKNKDKYPSSSVVPIRYLIKNT